MNRFVPVSIMHAINTINLCESPCVMDFTKNKEGLLNQIASLRRWVEIQSGGLPYSIARQRAIEESHSLQ